MFTVIAIYWFGFGLFAALMQILQWYYEGCLIHEGEDRYYYLNGMLLNVAAMIITGPVTIITQFMMGMPIVPKKR